jgi:hypothetical protein
MKPLLTGSALALALPASASAQDLSVAPLPTTRAETITREAPPPASTNDHPTPRLELSYERLSAGNVDGTAMPLEALHLDMYALSWRWLRAGVEAEAGRGHAEMSGASASVKTAWSA